MIRANHLTREGYEKLSEELKYMKEVRRPEVTRYLRESLEDREEFSENLTYEDAKSQRAFVEGRIQVIENILSKAIIVEDDEAADVISFGNRVTVSEDGAPPEVFRIVGSAEANPEENKISEESPVGHALLGSRVGDTVTVNTPDGPIKLQILSISWE